MFYLQLSGGKKKIFLQTQCWLGHQIKYSTVEDKLVKEVLHVTLVDEDDTVEENIIFMKGGHLPFKEKKKELQEYYFWKEYYIS